MQDKPFTLAGVLFRAALAISVYTLSCMLAHADTIYTDPASFAAAASISTTIGFEGIAKNNNEVYERSGLTVSGVTFTHGSSRADIFILGTNYYYPGTSVLSSQDSTTASDEILITLPAGVTAIGLDYGTFNGTLVAFEFSDGNAYVESGPDFPSMSFFGITTSTPIKSLTIFNPSSDVLNIDNFAFGSYLAPAIVAEPVFTCLDLFGALALIAGHIYRRRHNSQQPQPIRQNSQKSLQNAQECAPV